MPNPHDQISTDDSAHSAVESLINKPKPGISWRSRNLPWIAAIAIMFVGLAITANRVNNELSKARHSDKQRFARLTERVKGELVSRVTIYSYGLRAARSLFPASKSVERHEFRAMVFSRDLAREFPGALGIGYIERVSPDPILFESFLHAARKDGAPDFQVKVPPGSEPMPGSLIDDRMIIRYIMPLEDNRSALGLDIGAHPVRREAAERAMTTGKACITGRIELVQDNQKVAGFLYLLPVYRKDAKLTTEQSRIDALRGWVYMPILGPNVLEGAVDTADDELDLMVFDGDKPDDQNLIYMSHKGEYNDPHQYRQHASADTEIEQNLHLQALIEIGGRTWTVSLISNDHFAHASRSSAWLVGLSGTTLTILLAYLALLQGSATRRAWAIAENMTQNIRQYAEAARAATLAKSEFLANMSHEIRTPMTAILGYGDLMSEDPLTPRQQENLETIKRNGKHLLSVINDILDLSKIEAGKLQVETIPTSPSEIVQNVLSLMTVQARAKGLRFDAHFDTEIPQSILSDPVRLRQIMVNLVGNAIKFTELGGVQIRVRLQAQHETLVIEVSDTGIGMQAEQLDRLFQSFEQADASTTRKYGGSGLGLQISQRLAAMLGGSITADSIPGKGSCFTLQVKTGPLDGVEMLSSGQPKVVESMAHADATANESALALAGMRILLAEDGLDNQRLIAFHLRKAGAEVVIVENGLEAIAAMCINDDPDQALRSPSPFDLILSDMQMPILDGYNAVAKLRHKGSTLPIIALTAHAMNGDQTRCLEAGCNGYESKPIERNQLLFACRNAVDDSFGHSQAA